jgi:alpha-L-fucosidase
MNRKLNLIVSACMVLLTTGLFAQTSTPAGFRSTTSKQVMDEFMSMRFGMFIHWGPVTLRGTEIGWSRGHQVPTAEYDNLYKEFNPLLFNADEWVKTAKDAGMKYITITSKHHDGFCLWPSAYTEYDIMASPYKKDIVGELAKACKKYDIKFCVYFTILDWHNPDYPVHNDGKEPDPKADMNKFILTIKSELKEIINNYNPYMIWFDGQWESPWTNAMGIDMYNYLKSLNKDLIINNRLGKEMTGVENTKFDHTKMIGDYDTPEQRIGNLNLDFPWESCITICNQWAWKPNDKMKSLQECLFTLIKTASGNGNLLLNVGPMLDGRIEHRQVEVLKQMGDWLKIYGESIYGTMGGPYTPNELYSATRKGDKVYVHLFNVTEKEVKLPVLPGVKVVTASVMNGGTVLLKESAGQYIVSLPAQLPDALSNVLVLQLDKQTSDIPVINTESKKGK